MSATDDRRQTVMGRALLMVESFRESDGLTLTELANHTGLPRSSSHRMLVQLVEVGWIRRSGTTYHLGPKLAELGSLAQTHDRVHRAAQASMYRLHRRSGAVVHLAVLDGEELLYLDKIGGRWAATLRTRVGQRRPIHETAEGAALAAKRDGYADSVRERVHVCGMGERIHCLAAAFDAGHSQIAALSLTSPDGRMAKGAGRELRLVADMVASRLAV